MFKAGKNNFEIDALKEKLCEQEQLVRKQALQIAALEEQLQLARHKRFGASSEKASSDQLNLFNEAEASAEPATTEKDEIVVPEYKRKKARPQSHRCKPAAHYRWARYFRRRKNLPLRLPKNTHR